MLKLYIKQYKKINKNSYQLSIQSYPSINGADFKYVTGLTTTISREVLMGTIAGNLNKFVELIRWNENGQRYAICIGYNPAQLNSTNFDKTNELLIHLLQNHYDGYYLFNLYGEITPQKVRKSKSSSLIECIVKTINNSKTQYDVHFFWGNSVYINETETNCLKSLKANAVYTIGTKKVQHHHPGRGVSQNTITRTPIMNPIEIYKHKLV